MLEDFNLESNVQIRARFSAPAMTGVATHFDGLWCNRPGRVFSGSYEHYRDESVFNGILYRFMETSGFSTS